MLGETLVGRCAGTTYGSCLRGQTYASLKSVPHGRHLDVVVRTIIAEQQCSARVRYLYLHLVSCLACTVYLSGTERAASEFNPA